MEIIITKLVDKVEISSGIVDIKFIKIQYIYTYTYIFKNKIYNIN